MQAIRSDLEKLLWHGGRPHMDSGPAPRGASRNDDVCTTTASPSRRAMRPSFARKFRPLHAEGAVLPQEGSRECRALDAPAASRVEKNTRVSHHGHAGSPGIPRAMVLTAYFALSPVTGLVCHRRQWSYLHQLDASVGASGPHDFAVRVQRHSSFDMPRPPHPVPYVRDDRETPLCVGRDSEKYAGDLGQKRIEEFLQRGLDTPSNRQAR